MEKNTWTPNPQFFSIPRATTVFDIEAGGERFFVYDVDLFSTAVFLSNTSAELQFNLTTGYLNH